MQQPTPSSFMIPPTMRAPVLTAKSGRWASEVMTGETAGHGMFPSASGWGDMGSRVGSNATPGSYPPMPNPSRPRYTAGSAAAAAADGDPDGGMGPPGMLAGTASFGDGGEPSRRPSQFPPPPPPPLMPGEDIGRAQQRMMRWFQVVELWEAASVDDRARLVVAPVPRPPPFVAPGRTTVPMAGLALLARANAPYDFRGWVAACRRWWPHVARHFERLAHLTGAGPSPPVSLVPSPQPVSAGATGGGLFPAPTPDDDRASLTSPMGAAAAPAGGDTPSAASSGMPRLGSGPPRSHGTPPLAPLQARPAGGVVSPGIIAPPQPPPPDLLAIMRGTCIGFDDC